MRNGREVIFRVLAETSVHAGHLDIVRDSPDLPRLLAEREGPLLSYKDTQTESARTRRTVTGHPHPPA